MADQPGERFSLLMCLWAQDRPDFLTKAWDSTVVQQTRRPDEVVVVQDGPIGTALADTLGGLVAASPVPVQHVVLEHNVGLGPALDRGLAACHHDVVARMDADDISLPQRFAVQLPLIEAGADIVGSALIEFGDDGRGGRGGADPAAPTRSGSGRPRTSATRSTTRPSSTAARRCSRPAATRTCR